VVRRVITVAVAVCCALSLSVGANAALDRSFGTRGKLVIEPEGRMRGFFATLTGTFEIDSIEDGVPTYTGRFATRAASRQNRQSAGYHITFTSVGSAPDDTRIRSQFVAHLNRTPGGFEHVFVADTVSCPL
jgi:hypothetical protein